MLIFIKNTKFEDIPEEYFLELKRQEEIREKQIERLSKINISLFIEKVKAKYRTKAYKDRWYKRNIEPPEPLYDLIRDYAEKYGRQASPEEWEKYGTSFTVSLLVLEGYYINSLQGQGSAIIIH